MIEQNAIDRQIAVIADHPLLAAGMPDPASDRFVRRYDIEGGLAALDEFAAPELVIVDISTCSGRADELIQRLNTLASTGDLSAIVIFPCDCIDEVSALVDSPGVTLLCEPSAAERIATVGFAATRGAAGVRETRDPVPPELQSLADEVSRIAKALAALANDTPRSSGIGDMLSDGLIGYRAEPAVAGSSTTPVGAGEVRAMLRARRLRERFLPPELFGEPAWDMLLDLFAAQIERTKVAVSSLCIAAAVPPTTALRTIRSMTEQGLFARIADPADKRRVFIELTDTAAKAMQAYVAAARAV